MPTRPAPLLRAEAIAHRDAADEELCGVSLRIQPACLTLITGAPGSGAALLLRVLGLLERPASGDLFLDNEPVHALDDAALLQLRNHTYGFLFAEPFLLESFNVAENVAMPLFKIRGMDFEQARIRTADVIGFAGLADVADTPVSELSTFQRHQVSLARAVAITPRVLIAEDAGAQLAERDLAAFAALLRAVPDQLGIAVIATSAAEAGCFSSSREIRLEHGRIAADSRPVPTFEEPAHD